MSVKSMIACAALGLASSLIAAPTAFAFAPQTVGHDTVSEQNLGQLLTRIKYDAAARGIQLKDFSVKRTVGMDVGGRHYSSKDDDTCTVKTKVMMGGSLITVSVTASTCAEAAQQLAMMISSISSH